MKYKKTSYLILWTIVVVGVCAASFNLFYRMKYLGQVVVIREELAPLYFHDSYVDCFNTGLEPLKFSAVVKSCAERYGYSAELKFLNIKDICGHLVFETIWQRRGVPGVWKGADSIFCEKILFLKPTIYPTEEIPCEFGGFSESDLHVVLNIIDQLPNRTAPHVVEVEARPEGITVYTAKHCLERKGGAGTMYSFKKDGTSWILEDTYDGWHVDIFPSEEYELFRKTVIESRTP